MIEKLLRRRKKPGGGGGEEYLVRWKNYPPSEDSWEPREELERNSIDLINEFNRIERDPYEQAELHCLCLRPYKFDQGGMIQCNQCCIWYHFTCLGINMEQANLLAAFYCPECKKKNPSLMSPIKKEKIDHVFGQQYLP